MQVEYSGWNQQYGSFSCEIFIDENRTDYEIHYKNGTIAKQTSPFRIECRDWNHDGDVYEQFGAWFAFRNENGSFSGADFWTPESMVRVVVDAQRASRPLYGNEVVAIPGIEIPLPKDRPKLKDKIRQTEARSLAQDIARNRKMNALGIRPPNEPWAK